MVELVSEVSYFIPEPMNFAEVIILSADIRKPWLKATLKDINNLINSQTLLVYEPENAEPMTPCMVFYKANIWYDGSLDKLKMIIVVREDLQHKSLIGAS